MDNSMLNMGLRLLVPNPRLACQHFWNMSGLRVFTFQSPRPPKVGSAAFQEKGAIVHLGSGGRCITNLVDGTKGLQEILGWKRRCDPFCPRASGLDATVSKHRVTMALSCDLCNCPGYPCVLWAPLPPQKGPASWGSMWSGW